MCEGWLAGVACVTRSDPTNETERVHTWLGTGAHFKLTVNSTLRPGPLAYAEWTWKYHVSGKVPKGVVGISSKCVALVEFFDFEDAGGIDRMAHDRPMGLRR